MSVDVIEDAIELMKKLKPEEQDYVLLELMVDESIDIARAITLYATHLQDFKHSAKNDIRKLADAGLMLGEKEIKKIPTIKKEQKRTLYTGLAETLLSVGTMRGTIKEAELRKFIDMSKVDKGWYDWAWRLETVQPTKKDTHETN